MIIFKIFFTKAQPSSLKNHEVFQLAFVTLISWNWGCYFMLAMLGTWRCKSLKASVKIATITTPNSSNFFVVPVFFFFFACLFVFIAVRGFSPKKVGYEYISKTFFFWTGFFSFLTCVLPYCGERFPSQKCRGWIFPWLACFSILYQWNIFYFVFSLKNVNRFFYHSVLSQHNMLGSSWVGF